MKKLFSCLYGSNLYGTNTPESDLDIKHIILPELDDMLLGKKLVNKVYKTNKKENTRNDASDVDEEWIPIQIFARDFMQGQTYALELAYAIDGNHAEQTIYVGEKVHTGYAPTTFTNFVKDLKARFLTSNIKAMMNYAVNQASVYSFKGERFNAAQDFLAMLKKHHNPKNILSIQDLIYAQNDCCVPNHNIYTDALALEKKHPKYFKVSTYDIGGGRMKPCFIILEKVIPLTVSLGHAIERVVNTVRKYGDRVAAASHDNVDWKATMHAMRIVDEGLKLLQYHKIEFPLPQGEVERLLAIKRGDVPIEQVKEQLDLKLNRLKELEVTTTLPSYSEGMREEFDDFLACYLHQFYNL